MASVLQRLKSVSAVVLVICVMGALSGGATASNFDDLPALSDSELDQIRGGFEINNGGLPLAFSFGIEQATFVNGQLVAATTLVQSELSSALSSIGTGIGSFNPITVIQNGPGNVASLPRIQDLPLSVMSVVQNSLDSQAINTLTVINASITIQEQMRSLELQHALNYMNFNSMP